MKHLLLLLFLNWALLTAAGSSRSAELPAEPILRIEAGTHTAGIWRIGTDAAGRWAVTASDDCTVRIWDVGTGHLLRILRPPSGLGKNGRLYAVAMSPDGSVVAAAGYAGGNWTRSMEVYVFERETGRMLRRLDGLPAEAYDLSFSPDGRWLALAIGEKNGIRVWDWRRDGSALFDTAYGGSTVTARWSSDGRLLATSFDGTLRAYRVNDDRLDKVASTATPGGSRPRSAVFSPGGGLVAVGYQDSRRVDVFDGHTLAWLFSPDTRGVDTGNLFSLAWSRDGQVLIAGGEWTLDGKPMIRRWSQAGHGPPSDTAVATGVLRDIAALPQGGWLVATSDAAWGVVDGDGTWHLQATAAVADLRGSVRQAFLVNGDATVVQFGYEAGGRAPYTFDLKQRTLRAGSLAGGMPARTDSLPIEGWDGTTTASVRSRPLQLNPLERARSVAIDADAQRFVLGGDFRLRAFDAQGQIKWQRIPPAATWGVNIPTEGRVLVAAYGDGTIRWHRLSDGQELLALFPHADRLRWVLWTPSGYFDASPGAADLIGWQVNRGADQAADFFPVSIFHDRFYRPDIVDRVLATLDEGSAIIAANAGRTSNVQPALAIVETLPPVVELVTPSTVATSESSLTIQYRVRTGADAPVTRVFARVDGLVQAQQRNIEVVGASGVRRVVVSLPKQDGQVRLFAENRHGLSVAATVMVTWAGTPAAPAQPRLYMLAIGVSAYRNSGIPKLSYAAKDARDFAEAMQRQQGQLYKAVDIRILTDERASKEDVLDGLEWLQKEVKPDDVGILFLSGHGMVDPGAGYLYLPFNADPDRLKGTGVSMSDLTSSMRSTLGKMLVFLDTCHAGSVLGPAFKGVGNDINGVINELANAENGVVVFSSSTGLQLSLEDAGWRNGAFTKALVEGLDGRADFRRSGRVTYKMLDVYVSERVKELTKGRQSPVTQDPGGVNDFPIALYKP